MVGANAAANARPVAMDDAPRIDTPEAKVTLRSFFPETWLFTLELVNDGSTNLLRYFLMVVVVVPVVLESSCIVSSLSSLITSHQAHRRDMSHRKYPPKITLAPIINPLR